MFLLSSIAIPFIKGKKSFITLSLMKHIYLILFQTKIIPSFRYIYIKSLCEIKHNGTDNTTFMGILQIYRACIEWYRFWKWKTFMEQTSVEVKSCRSLATSTCRQWLQFEIMKYMNLWAALVLNQLRQGHRGKQERKREFLGQML